MNVKCLFTDHPASVGETYREHMGVAFSFAGPLFKEVMSYGLTARKVAPTGTPRPTQKLTVD